MSRKLQLIRKLIFPVLVIVGIIVIVIWYNKEDDSERFAIDETPIKVEMVKNIAEIATVSFNDEVVVDSVEYYHSAQEQIAGNLWKLTDPNNFKYGIRSSAIKRRVTLIARGELRVGFDLKKYPVSVEKHDSMLIVYLPQPQVLDVLVPPSSTEIYQEHGDWKDYEITRLHNIARRKISQSAETMKLGDLAKANIENLFRKMVPEEERIEFRYQ